MIPSAIAFISVSAVIGVSAVYLKLLLGGMEACETAPDVLSLGPAKYDAEAVVETCDGIAGSNTELVYLRSKVSGSRSMLFSYGRMSASSEYNRQDVPPSIAWVNDHHIVITIDVVSDIVTQRDTLNGVRVDYRIGHVAFRAHKPEQASLQPIQNS